MAARVISTWERMEREAGEGGASTMVSAEEEAGRDGGFVNIYSGLALVTVVGNAAVSMGGTGSWQAEKTVVVTANSSAMGATRRGMGASVAGSLIGSIVRDDNWLLANLAKPSTVGMGRASEIGNEEKLRTRHQCVAP